MFYLITLFKTFNYFLYKHSLIISECWFCYFMMVLYFWKIISLPLLLTFVRFKIFLILFHTVIFYVNLDSHMYLIFSLLTMLFHGPFSTCFTFYFSAQWSCFIMSLAFFSCHVPFWVVTAIAITISLYFFFHCAWQWKFLILKFLQWI